MNLRLKIKLVVVPAFITVALVTAAAFSFSGSSSSSSPQRTIYSAVYSLKHKNFGRFCSYLAPEFKSPACPLDQAGGWATNAVLGGLDIFDGDTKVIASSAVELGPNKWSFVVFLPALIPTPFYEFTVVKQESGKWRITGIQQVSGPK